MLGEIGLRSDHGKANIGTNPHGHHVLGDLLAQADAGVEALSGNIDETPSILISTLTSGYFARAFESFGQRIVTAG